MFGKININTMKHNRTIIVPHGVTQSIAKELQYGRVTVWRALRGRSENKIAKLIRAYALEHGGKYLED